VPCNCSALTSRQATTKEKRNSALFFRSSNYHMCFNFCNTPQDPHSCPSAGLPALSTWESQHLNGKRGQLLPCSILSLHGTSELVAIGSAHHGTGVVPTFSENSLQTIYHSARDRKLIGADRPIWSGIPNRKLYFQSTRASGIGACQGAESAAGSGMRLKATQT